LDVRFLVLAVTLLTVAPATVRAQTAVPEAAAGHLPVILTTNSTLQASLDRIAASSESWRQAVDAVAQTGRRVLVLTPDQVVVADPLSSTRRAFDPSVLAEVGRVPGEGESVNVVLVVVNVALLEAVHRNRRSLPIELEDDVTAILVHEVYGHAFPLLLAGGESGHCADPAAGQRAAEACSIRRENVVRAEMGLSRRSDYGLASLALARMGNWGD
jgi:hypothetical protein